MDKKTTNKRGRNQTAKKTRGRNQTAKKTRGRNQTAKKTRGRNQTAKKTRGINQTAKKTRGINQTAKKTRDLKPKIISMIEDKDILNLKNSINSLSIKINSIQNNLEKKELESLNINKTRYKENKVEKTVSGSIGDNQINKITTGNEFTINTFVNESHIRFETNKLLIESLKKRCLILDEHIITFEKVDRKNYMSLESFNEIKYMDRPSPIGFNQTISAPHMHAYAIKKLSKILKPGISVLDVGCGSGYLTAIMAYCIGVDRHIGNIVGIDIYDEIVELCKNNIKKENSNLLENDRLKIIKSNGWYGYPPKENREIYDCIHVGARTEKLPLELWNQLKPQGIILIPIGDEIKSEIKIFYKPKNDTIYGNIYEETDLSVRYVPLQKPIE
jgi:protein-L-isoaspartate(D-aspartate) O-methyltransferase